MNDSNSIGEQRGYAVRCEWGVNGVATLAPTVDVLIVVDVLSFSTCVDVASIAAAAFAQSAPSLAFAQWGDTLSIDGGRIDADPIW